LGGLVSVPKRDGLFIGLILFLTLGTAVSAQGSFGGPNPLSMLLLFSIIFSVCTVVLGGSKLLLYRYWYQRSSSRARLFYLVSSAIELAGCVVLCVTFKFDESMTLIVLGAFWSIEIFVTPLILKRLNPESPIRYFKQLPFSFLQALALPSLGLVIYLISSLSS
jgi:hypothetical protein